MVCALVIGLGGLGVLAWRHFPARNPATGPGDSSSIELPVTSPVPEPLACSDIYKAACQKGGEGRDPTGIVKTDLENEKQTVRTYEDIIRAHPDWDSDRVDEELVRTIYTPRRRARMQAAYAWVQNALARFIDRQPSGVFTHQEKELLKTRLAGTELQLPPPASVYADEPELFSKNDIYYERTSEGKMRLRFGGAYLQSGKSWFNIIFSLSHELSHSIDPCELKSIPGVSIASYDRLAACFMKTGLVAQRKNRHECGENDQLSEAFADWMAVQITEGALKTFSTEFHGTQLTNAAMNAVRDLCEQEDEDADTEFHPSPQVRIQEIFGKNPGIRSLLGCAPSHETEYCNFIGRE